MKKTVLLITLFAFILRLGLGLTAAVMLPQIGYESKPQQAGYLFFDAYRRDSQAWDLAKSDKPLARAFDQKYASDQYGGLLWMSAFAYRYLGGGVHHPLLVVIFAALAGSLGVLFVYWSARRLFDEKTALFAAALFAFFPETILLGAAQMREPFLMTFVAMAFYGLVEWQAAQSDKPGMAGKLPWVWMGAALVGMLFISPGFVLVTLVAAAGWLYFAERGASGTSISRVRKIPWQFVLAAAGLFVLALFVLTASWNTLVATNDSGILGIIGGWARGTAKWNAYLLGRSSGIVQVLFEALPPVLALPFVTIYGVLQPVLPAALMDPSVPFWQILGIIRAVGWYLLLPLLAFAPFSIWALPADPDRGSGLAKQLSTSRGQWLWLSAVVWGWILIAAVRGGGDQWDNPRYRVILMAWIAILAAQAFYQMKSRAGRWFWRIVAVETIILLVFGHWYSWRYLGFGFNIGIRNSLVIAIGSSVVLVLGDWLWQRFRASGKQPPP
jgi:4-amino-4-deoxy-L-arabinose transferase-like glycosyltransferase